MEYDEPTQSVRPVHKNNLFPTIHAPVVQVVINVEPNGRKIILWDDILQAFNDANHARHGTKILPFLKDPDYNYLRPLRFNAVPDAILDIVVDGRFTSTDPPPVQSTFQGIADHSSQYPRYNPLDRLGPLPVPNGSNRYPSPYNHSYLVPDRSMPTPLFWNEERVPSPQPPHAFFQQARPLPSRRSPHTRLPSRQARSPTSLPSRAPPPPISSMSSRPASAPAPIVPKPSTSVTPKPPPKVDVREAFRRIVIHVDLITLGEKGDGTPVEFLKALLCYLKAVHKGHGYATFSVGELFAQGKEVDQDDYRAFVWYLKAAYLGNDVAQRKVSRLIYNQPSRSTAAPEAVLEDAVKITQVEPAVAISSVVVASSVKDRPDFEDSFVARRAATPVEKRATTPLEEHATTPLMILETPAETPAETPLMILEASAGTPELTNSTLWVAPNSSRTIWEPSSFQNADDAPVALAVADPEPDDGYKAFTPMPYMPLLPHPLITTTTKTLRSPQTYHGDEAPIISTSLYSGHIDTPPAPKLNTREFHHALFNAEDGDTEFQVKLGDMYLETKDSRHNEAALGWFLKAAQQGDPNAQTRAGIMFMYGQGTPLSYSKAMTWFLKAAKNGHATAQCNIGCLYHEGHGVDQLYSKAMEWYLRAAEQGFPEAQTKIGTMYEHGHGVTRSYKKALEWYRKAAEQGDEVAQRNLVALEKHHPIRSKITRLFS